MKIAVEGCCHGELHKIFATINYLNSHKHTKINLLLICGDFQAIRNQPDLASLACPPKYRALGTFHEYYAKTKAPPCPVIFIGGNHEASNYLWELYHGGWVSPDIYFLGFAGVVKFGGIRIAGISGIYKQQHYQSGYYEKIPYSESDIRSIYHVRQYNVFRLAQIRQPVDIFLSHDWPSRIAHYGDTKKLLSIKSFLADEIYSGTLGSPPNEFLLTRLKPEYWFSAHMHVKFSAIYPHQPVTVDNPDEIEIVMDDTDDEDEGEGDVNKKDETAKPDVLLRDSRVATKFLALDKCLPNRDFLQVIEVQETGPLKFEYDQEWLAIMKSCNDLLSLERTQKALPSDVEIQKQIDIDLDWVHKNIGNVEIPDNFEITTPPHGSPEFLIEKQHEYLKPQMNPQTVQLCELLKMENKFQE